MVATLLSRHALDDLSLRDGTNIELAARDDPVDTCKDKDGGQDDHSVVHGVGGDRVDRGETEDDTDKGSPDDGPAVDKDTGFAHVPRTGLEATTDELADDGNAVRPIEGDGTSIFVSICSQVTV